MTHAEVDINGLKLLRKIVEQLTLIAQEVSRDRGAPVDRLMTTDEAASFLAVKADTLAIWRHRGTGPKYHKVGASVRYRKSDLEAFLEERRVGK